MLRTLLLLLSFLFVSGCSTFESSWKIESQKKYRNLNKLKPGDIILTEKDWRNPMSWFGHSAVMVDNYRVGDYAGPFEDYYEMDVILWLADKRKDYTVLRYKKFTPDFQKLFFKNLTESKNKSYLLSSKTEPESFYCSKHIWYLFWKTAKDLGRDLDIDKTEGFFVTPYDLMNSLYFEKLDI